MDGMRKFWRGREGHEGQTAVDLPAVSELNGPPDPRQGGLVQHLALPDAQDRPPFSAQLSTNSAITTLILRHLLPPKRCVMLGGLIAAGAPMPEATINEHCHLRLDPSKVGSPAQWQVPTPSTQTGFTKCSREPKLGTQIALTMDCCQHPRTVRVSPGRTRRAPLHVLLYHFAFICPSALEFRMSPSTFLALAPPSFYRRSPTKNV